MKIQKECIPCLLTRIIFESEQSTKDKKLQEEALKKACTLLAKLYDPNDCSAVIATKVHKLVYETLGDNDPYKKLKKQSNDFAKKLIPKVQNKLKKSDDPLKTSMICSIIGNMMDFGIKGASSKPEKLKHIFDRFLEEGLSHDDYDRLIKTLDKSKKVCFFTDNCGEIVFDKILCHELKKKFPQLYIILVVKGENILSDATLEDALDLGFEEVVDEIITTGCYAVGVDFKKMSENLKKSLDESDLIICKGMANYESFSETDYRPISYLMRVKCSAIANSIGVKKDSNIIKLYD